MHATGTLLFAVDARPSPLVPRPSRRGFTLVELLVVITIIAMLAGMTLAGVMAARRAAQRAAIKQDIGQIQMSLETYKNEVGEYPPDFCWLNDNDDPDPLNDTAIEQAVKELLNRHLQMRFPRYQGDWDDVVTDVNNNYGVDITELDPAGALTFWLGGLPETTSSAKPAGFNADPANPFDTGLPRTEPHYDFDPERLELTETIGGTDYLRYRYRPELPAGIPPAPYVYFRAQRGWAWGNQRTYEFSHRNPTDSTQYIIAARGWTDTTNPAVGYAVPYLASADVWESEETYQIISAGLDGNFGERDTLPPIASGDWTSVPVPPPPLPPPPSPAYTEYPVTSTAVDFNKGDSDNMANFAKGKLEGEQQ